MERTKKQTKNTIAKVWEGIEAHFEANPPPIPNKTLLKWVEVYCPNSFTLISETMEKSRLYNHNQDIYHQDFSLILVTVNQFIQQNGFESKHTFMSNDMQILLTKIESTLKFPFTRKK